MGSRSEEERPKDWGASEVHDGGVPPPPGSPQTAPDSEPWDVHYDLSNWTKPERRQLAQALRDSQVSFSWEGDELVVSGDYEKHVDELVGLATPRDEDEQEDQDEEDGPGETRPTALDHLGGFLRAAGSVTAESVIEGIVGSI